MGGGGGGGGGGLWRKRNGSFLEKLCFAHAKRCPGERRGVWFKQNGVFSDRGGGWGGVGRGEQFRHVVPGSSDCVGLVAYVGTRDAVSRPTN